MKSRKELIEWASDPQNVQLHALNEIRQTVGLPPVEQDAPDLIQRCFQEIMEALGIFAGVEDKHGSGTARVNILKESIHRKRERILGKLFDGNKNGRAHLALLFEYEMALLELGALIRETPLRLEIDRTRISKKNAQMRGPPRWHKPALDLATEICAEAPIKQEALAALILERWRWEGIKAPSSERLVKFLRQKEQAGELGRKIR